jgi:hypothetical protein
MRTTSITNETTCDSPETERSIGVLLRLAAAARLYRAGDGGLHAQVPVGDRHETYGLKSAGFRDWLVDGYFAERHEPASPAAIQRVVSVLEARARFDGATPSVFVRVARGSGLNSAAYFLDLGDPTGRAVRISAPGWELVDRPEIQFRRPEGMLALPVPERGGSIELLRPYVNVTDDGFRLVVAWLTAALRPVGPYPILSLHGEQGSAKSTLAKIVRLLVDPQACPLLVEPASTRDLMVTAVNGWLLAYDNITAIPNWLSDSLCRLVYGGGYSGRALFSNQERVTVQAQRPVILNGIEDFVRKSDLMDRTVAVHLPTITPKCRRAEDEFWSAFEAKHPLILGAVLDAVAGGMRELPSVKLSRLPRMADFAKWGEAVGRGLGWAPGTFGATYEDNRMAATEVSLEGSIVARMVLELAYDRVEWEGTPTELFELMTDGVGRGVARSSAWPKSTRMFMNEVRRLAPQLRMLGVFVVSSRTRERRRVQVTREEHPELVGDLEA